MQKSVEIRYISPIYLGIENPYKFCIDDSFSGKSACSMQCLNIDFYILNQLLVSLVKYCFV